MLISLGVLLLGIVILTVGGEVLVKGATRLALGVGMTPLVVGLTVVAFGTSAPELFVSASSSLAGSPSVAVGNVIGSNILNVLLILGISAVIVPLAVQSQIVKLDLPVMAGATFVFILFALDGTVSRLDGVILVVALIAYIWYLIRLSKRNPNDPLKEEVDEAGAKSPIWINLGLILLGLGCLMAGSKLFVSGATDIARQFGLSELVIGLTVVAFGTSLPEIVTSIIAALRGQRDIAVGNIVGSNIFNILSVMGITSILNPVPFAQEALLFDIPVLVGVTIVCVPILWAGYIITRIEGAALLLGYVSYTTYLVLYHTHSPLFLQFKSAMIFFVLPLIIITVCSVAYSFTRAHLRELRSQK